MKDTQLTPHWGVSLDSVEQLAVHRILPNQIRLFVREKEKFVRERVLTNLLLSEYILTHTFVSWQPFSGTFR